MDLWLTRGLPGWLVARPVCTLPARPSPSPGCPPGFLQSWVFPSLPGKREGSDPVPSGRRCPPCAHQGTGAEQPSVRLHSNLTTDMGYKREGAGRSRAESRWAHDVCVSASLAGQTRAQTHAWGCGGLPQTLPGEAGRSQDSSPPRGHASTASYLLRDPGHPPCMPLACSCRVWLDTCRHLAPAGGSGALSSARWGLVGVAGEYFMPAFTEPFLGYIPASSPHSHHVYLFNELFIGSPSRSAGRCPPTPPAQLPARRDDLLNAGSALRLRHSVTGSRG